jgi:hypothetical protein
METDEEPSLPDDLHEVEMQRKTKMKVSWIQVRCQDVKITVSSSSFLYFEQWATVWATQ